MEEKDKTESKITELQAEAIRLISRMTDEQLNALFEYVFRVDC